MRSEIVSGVDVSLPRTVTGSAMKPGAWTSTRYVVRSSSVIANCPWSSARTVRVPSGPSTSTVAPLTGRPSGSTTRPVIPPARATIGCAARMQRSSANETRKRTDRRTVRVETGVMDTPSGVIRAGGMTSPDSQVS